MADSASSSDVSTPDRPSPTCLNSVRHGLRTVALVIPGLESEAEWLDFSADALSALAPEGAIESALSERIVELLWRGRRRARAEQRLIVDEHERNVITERRRIEHARLAREALGDSFYASAFDTEPREVVPQLLPVEAALGPIIRYEAHLSRQLYRAMHELEALQAARNGRALPLIRLGIHGLRGE